MVWSVVRDRQAVDDVLQSAYERAFRSVDRFEGRSSLKTWLHAICYRTAIDHQRYEGHRRHESIDHHRHQRIDDGGSERAIEGVLDGQLLAHLMSGLEPEQRALLYLTAALGYSFDETAEITGLRRGTVASKVSRAKRRLREDGRS